MRLSVFVLLIWVVSLTISWTQPSVWSLQKDVAFLASDLTEGRFSGSEGERLAARYIQERFQQMGVQPGGTNGYYQHFEFKVPAHPHDTDPQGDLIRATNVIGWLDNGAPYTVVIGAHYDHLGMGHHGSRHAGEPDIHNGADDNASGVAALLYIAEELAGGGSKGNNYLFIAFSGEELGLFGSKHFVANPTLNLAGVNYMLNMDMVGRLDSVLVINGAGTSPVWKSTLERIPSPGFSITSTDSGIGPSDHTSFYLKDIPSVHFFTGQHLDYHKPSDRAHLVNYEGLEKVSRYMLDLISELDREGKVEFSKTKDEGSGRRMDFKVTLGVMPDYTYQGEGMRIDGVIEGRPAQKAGLQSGDVILRIGDKEINSIQDYMEALSMFEKGEETMIKILREDALLLLDLEF